MAAVLTSSCCLGLLVLFGLGVSSTWIGNLTALTIPITTTLKPFLAKKGASADDVERMHAAWVKAVLMQAILWSHPYIKEGDF